MEQRAEATSNQKKLYNFQKFYPGDPSYNLSNLYKITGKLDVERFKAILEIVYNSLGVSKVNFVEADGEAFQYYDAKRQYQIEIVNNPGQTRQAFYEEVMRIFQHRLNTPINLQEWPLFTIEIFNNNAEEYYVIVSLPHIIADAYSFFYFIDLTAHYYNSGLTMGEIKAETEKLEDPDFLKAGSIATDAKSEKYFLEQLSGLKSLEIKKIKQKRNQNLILDGSTLNFAISKNLVNDYLKSQNISENAFFLAIYVIFLKKVLGENVIVTGMPVLNRTRNTKNSFGYYVNTLPFVADFNKIRSFKELISHINKAMISLMRYQHFDLDSLRPALDTGFNNFFTYNRQKLSINLTDCYCEQINVERDAGIMFEFRCIVENLDDNFKFFVEYGDFFKNINVKQILQSLIINVMQNEDSEIKSISVVTEEEAEQIEQQMNHYYPYPNHDSIKTVFERMAAQFPGNIALFDLKEEWTYQHLDATANRIAKCLLDQVPQDVDKIVVSLNRNNYLVAVILAILKLGKCYVPIDLNCPANRYKYILNDLQSTIVIGESHIQSEYGLDNEGFISVDQLIEASRSYPSENLNANVQPENLAYIIYTSGSTGEPKGVEIANRNLLSLLAAVQEKFDFSQHDVWTLFHSYGFDFSVWEIFGCLLNGGKLIIVDSLTAKSPHDFYQLLQQYNVTVLNQTPTAFKGIIQADAQQKANLSLRYVIFGGEALYFPVLKSWVERHPLEKTKLVNMYGITETTIHVTYYEIEHRDMEHNRSIIGKALSNLGIYITNEDGNILPQGVPGEIVVYGDGVSSGYLYKPELTALRFQNRIEMKKEVPCYKSGDLGLMTSNGNIEYLGRMDKQVQLRGFRIELGEIESWIIKSGLVKDCAVDLVNFDGQDDQRIVAYLYLDQGSFYNETELREILKTSLPLYMIPSLFVRVDRIPLTINGKIDLEALKDQITLNTQAVKGENDTERRLFAIVKDVLKSGDFMPSDNLLDVGVNSIHLTLILAKIKAEFTGIPDLTMLDLFQYTSVKSLAEYLDPKTKVDPEVKFPNTRSQLRKKLLQERRA